MFVTNALRVGAVLFTGSGGTFHVDGEKISIEREEHLSENDSPEN